MTDDLVAQSLREAQGALDKAHATGRGWRDRAERAEKERDEWKREFWAEKGRCQRFDEALARAEVLVTLLYDALRCEWPGIAQRLDGKDIEPDEVPLTVAWDRSVDALTAARAFLGRVETHTGGVFDV